MTISLEAGPWTFDVNNTYTSTDYISMSRNGMMIFKDIMSNLGWSVVASSNGSTVKNIGDSSPDLWLSTSNIVFATSGAHSWIIFYNSTCSLWFYINCNLDTNGRASLGVYYTNPGTNGTTSALPSTGSSFSLNSVTYPFFCFSSTYAYNRMAQVMHGMVSADGKSTRIFNYFNYNGTMATSMLLFDKLTNCPTSLNGDTYLFAASASLGPESPSANPASQSPTFNSVASGTPSFITLYNLSSQTYTSSCMTYEVYYTSGTTQYRNCPVSPSWVSGLPCSKMGVYGATTGPLGRLRDMWWGHSNHATLMTFPNDGTHQFIRFGTVLVPWNGTVPLGL